MLFTVDVDVAIARPPTPANTRTIRVTVGVDGTDIDKADTQAQLLACHIAAAHDKPSHFFPHAVVMPIASRIVDAIL